MSNLTNLLAFSASGLSFGRFTALMAFPQLVAVGVEYAVFRRFFATDLQAPVAAAIDFAPAEVPRYALAVLGLTLAGFAVTSLFGVAPAWAAAAGVLLLAARLWPPPRAVGPRR